MGVREGIHAMLTDALLTAIVADRIYPGLAPQDAAYPFILWNVSGQEPDVSHSGRSREADRYTYIFEIHSRQQGEAEILADRLDQVLSGTPAAGIGAVIKDDEFDAVSLTGSGGDQRVRTIVQQYIVWAG